MFVKTHPTNAGHPCAALHATGLLDELSGHLHLFAFICRLDVFQSGRGKHRAVFWKLKQRCLGSHFLPRTWWHIRQRQEEKSGETGGGMGSNWASRYQAAGQTHWITVVLKEHKQVALLNRSPSISRTSRADKQPHTLWLNLANKCTYLLVCNNKPICSNWWINYNYTELFKSTFDLLQLFRLQVCIHAFPFIHWWQRINHRFPQAQRE